MPSNGDCFFEAISYSLAKRDNADIPPSIVRHELVHHMDAHFERYQTDAGIDDAVVFARQLELLLKPGTWNCDLADLLPQACSECYGLSLDILCRDSPQNLRAFTVRLHSPRDTKAPLQLVHWDAGHYDVANG
jgi:hypothetical protein